MNWTFFSEKIRIKSNWVSPVHRTENEIDFIISNPKDIFYDVYVLNVFSTGSDRRMIQTKVVVNIKKERRNLIYSKTSSRLTAPQDLDKLLNTD